jgi:hypothetical protein
MEAEMTSTTRQRAQSAEELASLLGPAKAAEILVLTYFNAVLALDPADKGTWHKIISHSLNAGLTDGQLAESFSCNLMTINRWKRGQNAPAPMARKAIKEELLKMLRKKALSYKQEQVIPHLEAVLPEAVAGAR